MKPDPSHQRYIETLRRMTPEQRLRKAFDLYEFGQALFRHGLRKLYPDLNPVSFEALVCERLERCHNRTY